MASLSLPRRTMAYAAVLVTAAAVVLGASRVLIGAEAAHAGYLAVMFLLSPARALDARVRYAAAGWAVVVAMAGYAIGSLGIVPLLIGLVVVCLVQSLFRAGEVASMTRSPVNFVAFAAVAQTGAPWWHVLLGSLVGAGFMLALARVLPDKERSPLPPVRSAWRSSALNAFGLLWVRRASWPGGTPKVESPGLTTITGLRAASWRAMRENLRGLPMDSR